MSLCFEVRDALGAGDVTANDASAYGSNARSKPSRSVRTLCIRALAEGYLENNPDGVLDARGYLSDYRDALLDGVPSESFTADLMAGAGNELHSKFLAPHSSSALAVNSFGWFFRRPGLLDLPGHGVQDLVGFEQKFPTGLARAEAPHLDVVLANDTGIVVIESKCLEFLSPGDPKFSERYRTEITDERSQGPWYREMVRILEGRGESYRHLDAAQLIKHALGLSYQQERPVTLLYLWWEPANADAFPVFAAHRGEVDRFSRNLGQGQPNFFAMSYNDLWSHWLQSPNAAVRQHSRNLIRRYGRTI